MGNTPNMNNRKKSKIKSVCYLRVATYEQLCEPKNDMPHIMELHKILSAISK